MATEDATAQLRAGKANIEAALVAEARQHLRFTWGHEPGAASATVPESYSLEVASASRTAHEIFTREELEDCADRVDRVRVLKAVQRMAGNLAHG